MHADLPRILRLGIDETLVVDVTITNLEYVCSATGTPTRATLRIALNTRGATLEYRSLENWVRGLAQSKQWLTEELALAIKHHLVEHLSEHRALEEPVDTAVTVEIRHQETSGMHVRVVA